ncbi:MAG: hypothetical protein ABI164_02700, partial [Acidobacteriaceae bacterium]
MPPSPAPANRQAIPSIPWTEQTLLDTLRSNLREAIVVTSTVRAARALRQRYDRRQQAHGHSGWRTPQILAWAPWLETLWNAAILSGAETRVLLAELQELELWRQALEHDEAAHRTLSIDALAALAQRAWKQMHQYRIPLARVRGDSSLDARAFSNWAGEFEKLCRKSSFISPSLLAAAITQLVASQKISFPRQIFLLGFDRVTPAQTSLVAALTACDCSVNFVELQHAKEAKPAPAIACANHVDDEIEAAAQWARHTLLQDPSQRIGVIVPSLEAMRGAIDRTFRRVLAPSSTDIRAQHSVLPYEFSLGTPMHRLPQIRTALTLLRWLHSALPADDVSWLLVHGSFTGVPGPDSTSKSGRARLDRKFREREFQLGGPVSLPTFQQWV